MGRPRHLAITALAGLGVMLGTLVGTPTVASAANVSGTVKTGAGSLNVRKGPSTVTSRVGRLPSKSRITIVCQQVGQKVFGSVRTTNLWDRMPNGTYIADAYVVRGSAKLTRCGVSGQVSPVVTRPTTGPTADVPVSKAGWTAPIPGLPGSGFRTKDRPGHDGVDFPAKKNTPVRAAAAGEVIGVYCNVSKGTCDQDGSLKISGCGWYIEVEHAASVVTRYCHLIRKPIVVVGQRVSAGQILGYSGTSGNSSGPHLHFEVHTNAPPAMHSNAVSPVAFLKAKGVSITKEN